MKVFRLSHHKYSKDLSGKGAEKTGGRWNSKGNALIYTSESRALCTTEIAVHTPLGNLPVGYELITIEIPASVNIHELAFSKLPADWKSHPHSHSTQIIGDKFIKDGKYLVMKVPSAVVKGDFNFIINPFHPSIRKIKITSIESFEFDMRLFK